MAIDLELVKLAEKYCNHYHKGQFRKGSNQPFSSHPIAVARILREFGYRDIITQCIALLHDIVEDTSIITGEIKEAFGYEISNGVYLLSKNTIDKETKKLANRVISIDDCHLSQEDLYKIRLIYARDKIKRVKIADMIHNTRDLASLNSKGIERKIIDSKNFYIPMGKKVAPIMVNELIKNIENYKTKKNS